MALPFFLAALWLVSGLLFPEWIASKWIWISTSIFLLAWLLWLRWQAKKLDRWLKADLQQSPPALRGFWRDLADRAYRAIRLRERQLIDSHQQLQNFLAAMQASPNGVTLLDREGRIEWCNETASLHLGIDARRDHLQHVVHLVRDPVFSRFFARAERKGEVLMEGRSSSISKPLKISVQLHPYGDGRQMLLTRDVTALNQAEQMRRDFVANVSHEIRTPLTVLIGFVETLQHLPLDEAQRTHYLTMMASQANRMQSLVSDLLTLSQLEGSPVSSESRELALQPLLEQLAVDGNSLSAVSSGDGIHPVHEITWTVEPGSMLIGSKSELLSAFSNLVSNAVRYTPAGGHISIRWSVNPDGFGVFAVQDSGPGIAAEHLPRLSERFYRVDRSRSRETGGTGLGLAIAKHVAFRHGGDLRIHSKEGQGSTFELWFPPARLCGERSASPGAPSEGQH